jgi:hypothetical protein
MKGPSIVNHVPPRPMIDRPIGKTQHDADNTAKAAARGMSIRPTKPGSVTACSFAFTFILLFYFL